MKPSQLAMFLALAIPKRHPVLITGKPGVGKSDVVAQACDAAGARMILSHPAVEDPTDSKGLPWPSPNKKTAQFLPFGQFAEALAATVDTVWFLDDLGQAPGAVQAAKMQLILAREINGHRLPDVVSFIAATNRRTDRANVSGILEPVKSRFISIVELVEDLDDWCQWAFTQTHIPPELIAFLRFRPELLCQFTPTADMTNCPLPRTWSNAGHVLELGLPDTLEGEALAGAVGEGASVELRAFLRMFRQLPSIDAILINPDGQDIPTDLSALYATVTGLAIKANEQNFGRVARYAERLVEEGHGEFAALLIKDAERNNPELVNTPEFVRLMSGELGQLISGTA
ncbi:hypothetical protein LCGC14_0768490 [marine sediment metagenome]|uniref:AAA+ ATPase domain-containing protein n=1 Tax=marine sediment metagenome TaxID=412755 RepID=A0A0F9SJ10_9ZZZZ